MATILKPERITQFYDVGPGLQYWKIVISSAEVLAGNTTPIDLSAQWPAVEGVIYKVTDAFGGVETFGTAAYATNLNLRVYTEDADVVQFESAALLASTTERLVNLAKVDATGATDTQHLANKKLVIDVETGDPTAGDSDIVVYLSVTCVAVNPVSK